MRHLEFMVLGWRCGFQLISNSHKAVFGPTGSKKSFKIEQVPAMILAMIGGTGINCIFSVHVGRRACAKLVIPHRHTRSRRPKETTTDNLESTRLNPNASAGKAFQKLAKHPFAEPTSLPARNHP